MKSGGKKVVYRLKIDIDIVYIVLIVDRVILSQVLKIHYNTLVTHLYLGRSFAKGLRKQW